MAGANADSCEQFERRHSRSSHCFRGESIRWATQRSPPASPFTQVEWYRDPNQKNAYSEQWNFQIQRAVGSSTVVEAGYVGSALSRLTVGTYANTAETPGPGLPIDRAPYSYITPTYYDKSIGRGSYDAFQFRLEQRMTHGLQYLLAYTWSKSMDIGCSGYFSVEGCSVQNPYDLNDSRSVAGYDCHRCFR